MTFSACGGDPGGARTLDPLIKSQLLYQLSYGVFVAVCDCKFRAFILYGKFF